MPSTIRIVVADDHPLFRGGVVRTLAESDDLEVLAECGSAEEVIEAVGRLLPDIVLLDILTLPPLCSHSEVRPVHGMI